MLTTLFIPSDNGLLKYDKKSVASVRIFTSEENKLGTTFFTIFLKFAYN